MRLTESKGEPRLSELSVAQYQQNLPVVAQRKLSAAGRRTTTFERNFGHAATQAEGDPRKLPEHPTGILENLHGLW